LRQAEFLAPAGLDFNLIHFDTQADRMGLKKIFIFILFLPSAIRLRRTGCKMYIVDCKMINKGTTETKYFSRKDAKTQKRYFLPSAFSGQAPGAKVHEDDFGRQPPADYGKILLCSFSKRASVTIPNDFSAA
jgi:hypothetical protein